MISSEEIVIFLGPTLSQEEAKLILEARYFPPAEQGDLISIACQFRPKIIGIIDGLFHESLSVWHKEILYALDQGIEVFGASSMGAIRAAETAQFGMRGVGEIFQMYHDGTIQDDDEVALVHGPEETSFLPFSLPMVNIRYTLKSMLDQQIISPEIHDLFVEVSKALYFPERAMPQIVQKAREKGIAEAVIRKVETFFNTSYIDLKKQDALLLLKTIKEFSVESRPLNKPSFTFPSTSYVDALFHYDRKIFYDGSFMTFSQLVDFISLQHPDFTDLKEQALKRSLVIRFAQLLKIQPTNDEIEHEKKEFCLRHHLTTEQELDLWLKKNHLSVEEFHRLCKEEAAFHHLQKAFFEADIPWREVRAVLDQLKWKGQYEPWVEKAAATVSRSSGHASFNQS